MKKTRLIQAASLLGIAAIALSACSSAGSDSDSSTSSLSGTITAGGSSAQANAQAAWTSAFTATNSGVTINYDKSQGSGGGVTNFTNGSYDFAGSDAALTDEQYTAAKAACGDGGDPINLPVYLDGVSIIYKLDGVDDLKLDGETIAKIFAKQITQWDDPAIKALNPDATLPSKAITTVNRSDGSGTTANFTNYLSQVAPSVWTYKPGTKWPTEISTENASAQQGGSGVVNTVKAGDGTIGYADHSAIGDLSSASISVDGGSVAFSQDAVTKAFGTGAELTPRSGVANDITVKIDYTKLTSQDTYPIPLLSYAITCSVFKDSAKAELTKGYLSFITGSEGQQAAAANAKSSPLPDEYQSKLADAISAIK